MSKGTKFIYSFSPWPDETSGHRTSLFDLFRVIGTRSEMTFLESDFLVFQQELSDSGITLREIERVPISAAEDL